MILDKYSRAYKSEDLVIEWNNKIEQFKLLKLDFPQFANILNSLIELTEFIANSEAVNQLFPGVVINELHISPVEDQRIITNKIMRVYCKNDGTGPFNITITVDENEIVNFDCTDKDIIETFTTNLNGLLK